MPPAMQGQAAVRAQVPSPAPPAAAYAPAPAAARNPAIAPAPVVGIGSAAAVGVGEGRVCERCRGRSDPGAQFCKFCGAPLGGARQSPGQSPGLRASSPAPNDLTRPTPSPLVGYLPSMTPLMTPAATPAATPAIAPAPTGGVHPPTVVDGPTHGRLIVITKDGAEGPSYPIHDQLDIGRSEGDVVIADDRYLSPRHARIARRVAAGGRPGDVELVLHDLGSTNGVFLRLGNALRGDGRIEVELQDQDLFLVGQQVIRFEVVKDAEDGLGPATQHGTLLFGTPSGPRYGRLCQRTVEGVTRDVFYVSKVETVLGRESGDIVFTDDPFLSRRHALIRVDRDKRTFALADLGSSNGTFVQVRGEVSIKTGDQFRIGQQLFRVELGAS
jgi:pSer/pThr/pTyr-binding forkhead associated (FHA) protein